MIYKFPCKPDIPNGLLPAYRGKFDALYIPKLFEPDIRHCYVCLTHTQKSEFFKHFGIDETDALVMLDEYPGSEKSRINKKVEHYLLFVKQ